MDKRLLLAVVLSVLVVVGYQEYLRIYFPTPVRSPTAAKFATPAPDAAETASGSPLPVPAPDSLPDPEGPAAMPEADVTVETDVFVAKIASRGGRLASLALKSYRVSVDPASPPLEMVAPAGGELPLGIVLRGDRTISDRDVAYEAATRTLVVGAGEEKELVLRGRLESGATIEKRFVFRGGVHAFDVGIEVAREAAAREAGLSWTQRRAAPSDGQHFVGAEALVGRKLLYLEDEDLAEGVIFPNPKDSSSPVGPVQWGGYADSYFLSALAPNVEGSSRLWLKLRDGAITTEVLVPFDAVHAAAPEFTVYVGPKDLDHLAPAGHGLQRALDLGWFSLLAEVLLRVLKVFHRFTGNYGLDIILLTVLIKVLFIPLTQKSFKSMQAMQKVQPEMKKLQERFKDDREALNREMMELYRRHKVNPLGGCLPMLLQMPVFIGLYNALFYAVELRHAPFALWINDLSAPDRLPAIPAEPLATLFGFDVRIPVLTLLMGASMIVQQRMTPAMGDPMQQRMMMLMPVVFTVMFVSFPSGLVLYWLVNNVLTIAQQAVMQRSAAK
jgi:YidC/Oxa1 family membrane protein insertase